MTIGCTRHPQPPARDPAHVPCWAFSARPHPTPFPFGSPFYLRDKNLKIQIVSPPSTVSREHGRGMDARGPRGPHPPVCVSLGLATRSPVNTELRVLRGRLARDARLRPCDRPLMALVPLHLRWRPVGEAFKQDRKPLRVRDGLKNPSHAEESSDLTLGFVFSLLSCFRGAHAAISLCGRSCGRPSAVYFKTRKEPQ